MTQTQLNLAGHLEGHQVRLTCPSLPKGQSNFPIFWIISWNYLLSSACLLFLCLCRIGWFGCTCKLYLCKCLSSSVFGRNYWEHKNNAVIRYSALIHLHRFWILADIFTAYADEFLSYAYKFFLFLLVLRLNLASVWSILCTFASMSKKKKKKKIIVIILVYFYLIWFEEKLESHPTVDVRKLIEIGRNLAWIPPKVLHSAPPALPIKFYALSTSV